MQSRDDVADKPDSHRQSGARVVEPYRPYPKAMRTFAVALAWLIPGAGHLALGRVKRGLLLMILIGGAFFFGIMLHGRLFSPFIADPVSAAADPQAASHFDIISILWSFAQVGSGLCYFVSHLVGIGTIPHPEAPTYEYGNTFTFLAGLLNYLVVVDVFDIASGRKG